MALEVFWRFFLLGFTSFGGPAAHLGYFRKEFVERLHWCNEGQYSQWVALSQIMPGPGSSQVGFALGIHRAGVLGGIAAFVGFTSPSVIAMLIFAALENQFSENPYISSLISALKLLSIVVVMDAVIGMWRSFVFDLATRLIAFGAFLFVLLWPFGYSGLLVVILAGGAGVFTITTNKLTSYDLSNSKSFAFISLVAFVVLFLSTLLLKGTHSDGLVGYLANLYQTGALVFGGGHVVLPLVSDSLQGIQSTEDILIGYAAAQAVPGPMFTIATYLGAVAAPQGESLIWGILSTLAIFLPGLLLMAVGSYYWAKWSHVAVLQSSIVAINASVVGLLGATLINPIMLTSVSNFYDGFITLIVFIVGRFWRIAVWKLILVFSVWAAVRLVILG